MPNPIPPPETVRLETPRLVITVASLDDVADMRDYVARNEAHLRAFNPPQPADFHTEEYWSKRLGRAPDDYRADVAARFVARMCGGASRIVAVANLTQIFRGPLQCAVLGYSVDAAEQGQGVMTETLEAVVAFAFERLGLHRIEANYLPTNERSGTVLRRVGFHIEGYARDYLFIHGKWRDHVRAARTNPNPKDPMPSPP